MYYRLLFILALITLFFFLPNSSSYAQYPTPTPTPIPQNSYICGYVFSDANRNGGAYNPGEGDAGLWPESVTLSYTNGTPINTVQTDGTGYYCHGPLLAGDYVVSYSPRSGYAPTTPTSYTINVGHNATSYASFGVAIPPVPTISPISLYCSGNSITVTFSYSSAGAVWYQVYSDDSPSTPLYSGANTTFTEVLNYTYNGRQNYHYTVRAYYVANPDASAVYSSKTTPGINLPNCYTYLPTTHACNSSYTNNGTTVPAVWRPSNGTWYIYGVSTTQYGEVPSDVPVPADYDGDGIADFALFKAGGGASYTWLIRPSSGASQILAGFGGVGDIPVPGDYNGDSKAEIAVFRPSNGTWYINGQSASGTAFGQSGDIPVPADYDGDGKTDIAVWRPVGGHWYILQSTNGYRDEQYGEATTDTPVPGDYDGDGKADLALFKGAAPSGYNWLIRPSSGASQILAGYGGAGDIAVPGDYNGDGITDIAVWRENTGTWYIRGINDGGIGWGQPSDIPVACSMPTTPYTVSGTVFVDTNGNGTKDAGEIFYTGGTGVNITGGTINRNTTSDGSGAFSFTNVRPIGPTQYAITLTVPTNFAISTTNPQTVTVGPNQTVTFGIRPLYSISGVVFNDQSKDGIKNGSEPNMSSDYTIQVVGPSGNPTTQNFTATNGVYTTGRTLTEGTYTVSYTSTIPDGYRMTNPPPAISPPSFSVTIGTSCDASAALGASCISAGFPFTASNIQNLNFGMTNYIPWFQCIGNSCRIDGTIDNDGSTQTGFSDPIPSTALLACGGANASIPGSSTPQPGIIFSGGTAYFGQGQASTPQNWVVNDSTYNPTLIRTSYGYMTTTLRQSGITPIDLASVCTLSNCTLPADLANGVYLANGDVTLNAYTFPAGKSYVILVNGNLDINGEINIPVGSAVTFSVSGNITVDADVGVGIGNFCSQTANVDGFFSADGSFIIEGIGDGITEGNTDCNLYSNPLTRDQRVNIAGGIVVNAARAGGSLQNQRDLCDDDRFAPVFSIIARPDFLLNVPEFIKYRSDVWREIAP